MPKCINDETKTYKGDEPSPKGLGYSASKLDDGFKQIGKDGNIWIVQKTSKYNRWIKDTSNDSIETIKLYTMKKIKDQLMYMDEVDGKKTWVEFDFDNLPEDCYTQAYIPVCEEIKGKETGLEEKFGGNVSYHLIDDEYPKDMILLCQFKDPRTTDNIMYQVFINQDSMDYIIKKIDLDDTRKKIIVKNKSELKPYKIKSWNKTTELTSFTKLKNKFTFSSQIENILWDKYYDHSLLPSSYVKVGGTPMTTQNGDYDDMDLIQLSFDKFLNFEWGDAGIAHVSTTLNLEWDCY
jgi:hypothetical protein